MILAILLLQAAPVEPEQNRYACQLALHRLTIFSAEFHARLARRIVNRRHMLKFQRTSELIARPYLEDIRESIQDGDPAWVCNRIADQGIDRLKRDAIRPIFGDEPETAKRVR